MSPTILIFPVILPPRYRICALSRRVFVPELIEILPVFDTLARGRTVTWAGPTSPPSSQLKVLVQAVASTTVPDRIFITTEGAAEDDPA